jgi:hypothetical protein
MAAQVVVENVINVTDFGKLPGKKNNFIFEYE